MRGERIFIGLCTAAVGLGLAGCALLTPLPRQTTMADRLAAIPIDGAPLRGRVTILWNDHQVPFIEAEHDSDAAVALGLVHAHLRLGQMEIFRRISQGRISEMGGPVATDIDHGLRILNFGRAAAEMAATLPPETRGWLQAFVDGVNHYQRNASPLPLEYDVLGLDREPWTIEDVLTFGRLAGTDVNWLVWIGALELRKRPDWPQIWTRLVKNGTSSITSFDGNRDLAALKGILAGLSKSGSNSVAIAPARSKTGAAIMANDPHLGITLPNVWLIAGVKSPSYHAVGLMVPGLPIFAIGRNPWISWGGTNMRAASSDLYDISNVPQQSLKQRTETIKVRWWFDSKVRVRESEWGPVLSDVPMLNNGDAAGPRFALRWTGHAVSDEIGAMLRVSRARNFAEFQQAFRDFAVPGQNMLYADVEGNIGQVMAVRLPGRNGTPPDDVLIKPADANGAWENMKGTADLPFSLNPEDGFLVSANNRPAETKTPVGFFFSPDDRVVRMKRIIAGNGRMDIDDVKGIQQDVYMTSSVRLRDVYIERIRALPGPLDEKTGKAIDLMARWDGHYTTASRGAVAFELLHGAFQRQFYTRLLGPEDGARYLRSGRIKSLLIEDMSSADPELVNASLTQSLKDLSERIDDFATWGEMHRLAIAHPLSFLPLIGGRYEFENYPVGGSSDTLMKTAHGGEGERHNTRYGSNARHVSDMSDVDRNYFALIGGQDGWFRSANFADQVPLWLSGSYITVPLRPETIRKTFLHRTTLEPRLPAR